MLKNLFGKLFRRKKAMPEPARAEPRLPDLPVSRPAPRTEQRPQQPRASTPAASNVSPGQPTRHDDYLTNPLHPLNPLNPIYSDNSSHRAADPAPSCSDSHRSSWGCSSDHSSSCSSSWSSDSSSSSSSSSCD